MFGVDKIWRELQRGIVGRSGSQEKVYFTTSSTPVLCVSCGDFSAFTVGISSLVHGGTPTEC